MTYQLRGGFKGGQLRPQDRRPSPLKLPDGYLNSGYFDDKGNVLPEVIQSWPLDLARKFLQSEPKLNTAQLRRFYNKVCDIKQRLDAQQPFDSMKEQIYSFGPLAAASVGRGTAPSLFKEFVDCNIPYAVKSKEHFRRGFATHFQSIVAYVKYLEPKTQGGR
jgi:CRISPR type III-A-associated protein Csm2